MRLNFALSLGVIALLAGGCGEKPAPSSGTPAGAPPSPTTGSSEKNQAPIDPANAGSISGVVKLDGWIKPDAAPGIGAVPFCAAANPAGLASDTLVLGEGQTMANVLVFVKHDFGRKFPVPDKTEVLDQVGCMYTPHILAMRENQTLLIRNSDDTMHNVNGGPKLSKTFNFGQNIKGVENTVKFSVPELGVIVKCDVHPWMKAFVHVMAHPYFQVTGKDGAFKIDGLPPGEYEVRAWHEKFANEPKIAMVKVAAKGNEKVDFTFTGGTKPSK